ncbi:MAG TPA: ribonuclease Z [Flavobacteriales bacterium]|nr:ribonuclease Z [Flavobacteriales bacterium]
MAHRQFDLTTLGTGAALPARGRYPTAQLLVVHGAHYLIDCGEGTQERLRAAGAPFNRIGHIFISHLHGDHYLGLMGLISSMHLMGRTQKLHVHGPPMLKEIIDLQLRASQTYLRYPLVFQPIEPRSGEVIWSDVHVTVNALVLRHRIPCTGFVFRESPAQRPLRQEVIHQIPTFMRNRVKAGEDLHLPDGSRFLNAMLTHEPPRPRRYAYCSDTAYAPELLPFLAEVDLLYHEATFTRHLAKRAKETMHSTAAEAATLARDAGVGQLLLGHFSSRYKSADELLQEALPIFPDTRVSEDGATYRVMERGAN